MKNPLEDSGCHASLAPCSIEEERLSELWMLHHRHLHAYFVSRTELLEDAYDLEKETMLDAWRSIGQLTNGQPTGPWIFRIARNNVLPYWRAQKSLRFIPMADLDDGQFAKSRLSSDREATIEDAIVQDDEIITAFIGLSPILRQALFSHEIHGLTAREMAAESGISHAAMQQRVLRARIQFRCSIQTKSSKSET
jgi:RNA polymerase sigma-70 factor, ECF subfamily